VQRERGQSIVELALTLPLLAVLLVGLVEVAFFAFTYLSILESSREGARLGSRGKALFNDSEIETLVEQDLSRNGIYTSTGEVDVFIVRGSMTEETAATIATVSSVYPAIDGDRPAFQHGSDLAPRLRPGDPGSRFVIVEIFYDYHPLFGFPGLSALFPDPMPLHTYSMMRMLK
jgi:Flp pilus assembly protein TadG